MNRLRRSSGGNSDAGVSYNFQQTYSPSGRIGDKFCDFTHSDHLGSSSWTTDEYEARYNSSTYSQFTSPDPMSDKYPSVNPYLYCAGNPIMYVDPNGNEPVKNQVGTIEQFISFFNNCLSVSNSVHL